MTARPTSAAPADAPSAPFAPAGDGPNRREFLGAGLAASLPALAAAGEPDLDPEVAREMANRLRYLTPPDGLPSDLEFRPSPEAYPFQTDLFVPPQALPVLDLTALTFYLPTDGDEIEALKDACGAAAGVECPGSSLPVCRCRDLEWQVERTIEFRRKHGVPSEKRDPNDRTGLLRQSDFAFQYTRPTFAGGNGSPSEKIAVELTRQEREDLPVEDQLWLIWFRGLCLVTRKLVKDETAVLRHPDPSRQEEFQKDPTAREHWENNLTFILPAPNDAPPTEEPEPPKPGSLGIGSGGLDIGAPPDWRSHQRFFELKPKKLFVLWEFEFPWIYQDSKSAIARRDGTAAEDAAPDSWGHGSWTWGFGSLVLGGKIAGGTGAAGGTKKGVPDKTADGRTRIDCEAEDAVPRETHRLEFRYGSPGPTFRARYGEPILVRRANMLPEILDDDARWNFRTGETPPPPTALPRFFGERPLRRNVKFALPSTTSHLHNAHTASESDGHPNDWINPGEYWDHHYGNFPAFYDEREKLTTLWYHDHRMDFTAANVYAGLDGFYLLFDEITDRNGCLIPDDRLQDVGKLTSVPEGPSGMRNFAVQKGTKPPDARDAEPDADRDGGGAGGWNLPAGQEYDVPLILHDLLFGEEEAQEFAPGADAPREVHPHAQLAFDGWNTDGILGDRFTVNRIVQPRFQVERRKYRFRILNGGPSRFWELALHTKTPDAGFDDAGNYRKDAGGKRLSGDAILHPFVIITGDGNFQPNSVITNSLYLGVAQRADLIVDFSHPCFENLDTDDDELAHVYFVNQLQQINGKGPTGQYHRRDPNDMRAEYEAAHSDVDHDADRASDKSVEKWWFGRHAVLRFDLCPKGRKPNPERTKEGQPACVEQTEPDPSRFPLTFRDLPPVDLTEVKRERLFEFDFDGGLWTINGKVYDPNRIDAGIEQGSAELWTLRNDGNSWHHPIHSHFVEHIVVEIDGKPYYQSSVQTGDRPAIGGGPVLPEITPPGPIFEGTDSEDAGVRVPDAVTIGEDRKQRAPMLMDPSQESMRGALSVLGAAAAQSKEERRRTEERAAEIRAAGGVLETEPQLLADFEAEVRRNAIRCTASDAAIFTSLRNLFFDTPLRNNLGLGSGSIDYEAPEVRDEIERLIDDEPNTLLRGLRFESARQFEWVALFFAYLREQDRRVRPDRRKYRDVPLLAKFRFMGGPRRDVVLLLPGSEVKIFMRWGDFLGKHVMHCHNVVHEDHAMMLRWDIMPPGEGFGGSRPVEEVYGPTRRTPHVSPFPATIHHHVDDRDGRTDR